MKGWQFVREARLRADLTQGGLAAKAGTTQSAIARLEAGKEAPTLERLVQLVRACGFDLNIRMVPLEDAEWASVEELLRLTPAERVERHQRFLDFAAAGRAAMVEARHG